MPPNLQPEVANHVEPTPAVSSRAPLIGFAIAAVLLCALFSGSIINWVRFALSRDRNTYLLLVPFVCAYLIRTSHPKDPLRFGRSIGASVIPAALAAIAFVVAGAMSLPVDRLSLQIFALLNLLLACAFIFFGNKTIRAFAFPISFLIFAVPVPSAVVNAIELFLQHTSAEAAYWLVSLVGIPVNREGIIFRFPNIQIEVAQECSGYNSTFSLFLVSLIASYLFLKSNSRRAILALAVIPLAIVRNGLRITTISALCVYVDPELINSFIHHHGGPIFFALSLVPFLLLLWGLRRSEIAKDPK